MKILFLSLFLVGLKLLNQVAHFLPIFFKRSVHWVHAIVFEAIAICLSIGLRFIHYLLPKKNSVGKKEGRPILLIHGYMHNSSGWIFFRRALAKKGLGPIYTIDLFHPFRSISDYAAMIAKKREEIRKETGKEELVLVGHSMGGLVASWYAKHFVAMHFPTWIITLGSPLKGTYAALLALGPNGKEMRCGSSFTQEMQQFLQTSYCPLYHIGSMTDQIILPASSAFTGRSSDKEYKLEDLGHMSLLFSPRIVNKVADWIEGTNPRTYP